MMNSRTILFLMILAVVSGIEGSGPGAIPDRPVPSATPAFVNTCLITGDVSKLSDFYAEILRIEPRRSGDDYVEFHTPTAVLAVFSAKAEEQYIPGSAIPGQNRSSILEFRVVDVDREYVRLQAVVTHWVKGPTTQAWGTRSIYFRDPDGNLVNFFATASPAK
jgi:catechol 2,3-dioxygenase-like lactoylglutathione lyase family enzyme